MDKAKMDNAKKKLTKKYLTWGLLAALVVLLAVMPLLAQTDVEEDGPKASILSGTVTNGSVSTALHGGGNLEADDAEDITIPSGVKITEFLVSNGDVVTEGTPLATVDKVTVMTAITEVRDTMEYLQDEMESVRDATVSSYIYATAGGRVKAVYAEVGDDVQDVMLEHGALAVLSLDSMMAVTIERNMDVRTGDTVCVKLSDGTEVSGRVESNLNGSIVITVEDEGYAIGEKVTVTTEDGGRIGSGELYVHNAWKATAFTGTISTVNYKPEATVYSGYTLFTLTDTQFTAQLEYMANQHREYEELMQELFQMYETGTINAPCDGIISGIDKNSTHLLAAEETEWQAELLDAEITSGEEKSWSIVLLSNLTPISEGDDATDFCTKSENCQAETHELDCIKSCTKKSDCPAKVHYSDCITLCDHADTADGCDATVHYSDCIKGCTNSKSEDDDCPSEKHYLTCIESCTSSDGTTDCPATRVHKSDCIEACSHADTKGVCEATKHHYSDCIESCTSKEDCTATKHNTDCFFYGMTYKATAAKVTDVGLGLVVITDASGTVYTVEHTVSGWSVVGDTKLNTEVLVGPEASVEVIDPTKFSKGDIILVITGYKGTDAVWSDVVVYAKSSEQQSGMTGMGGMSGMAGMSGMSGMSGISGGSTSSGYELFDLDGDVLMTVTPQDSMTMTITLDEQDISKVSVGQAAEVKVEALKGETFEATVTKVGISGTNSGGSSKFTVELTMDKGGDMLAGMSATASIPLYTKMDVLTIPVAALVEDGAKTVVYTTLDKDSGAPATPVEVEVGISDGETAELLSGLESGATYYYSYYDTLELSTAVKSSTSGFPFG